MAKTKKPTGLTIERNGNEFTCSWKVADNNYSGGQKLRIKVNGGSWSSWESVSGTSKKFTFTSPSSVCFQIKGKQKKSGSASNKDWSDASQCNWNAVAPLVPNLEYNRNLTTGTFSWSVDVSETGKDIFLYVEYQTILRQDSVGYPESFGYCTSGTGAAEGELIYTEPAAGGVRWFRVRSVGPGGASEWSYKYHAYGSPSVPSIIGAQTVEKDTYTSVGANWNGYYTVKNPIDSVEVQYAFSEPTDLNFTPPSNFSKAIEVSANGGNDYVWCDISDKLKLDQCSWVRVVAKHDESESPSKAMLCTVGRLSTPEITSVDVEFSGEYPVTIKVKNNSTCDISKIAIFFNADVTGYKSYRCIDLESGQSQITFNLPWIAQSQKYSFIAICYIGQTYDSRVMQSDDFVSQITSPVRPPSNVILTGTEYEDSVRVSWEWTWNDATQCEVSWATRPDAWESNQSPNSYVVTNNNQKSVVITGLTYSTYYFRCRLSKVTDDERIDSEWTNLKSFSLSGIPNKPVLQISKKYVNKGEKFTLSWDYSNTDDSVIKYSEIIYDDGTLEFNMAHGSGVTSLDMIADFGESDTASFKVRVVSSYDLVSDWSEPIIIRIVSAPTILVERSLVSGVVPELRTLPMTVRVHGSGDSGTTSVSIVRAKDYFIDRPNEKDNTGYAGETIYSCSQIGESEITIPIEHIIGHLDQGAEYILKCSITDLYNQSADYEELFKVNWNPSELSEIPELSAKIYDSQKAAEVIVKYSGTSGGHCDIYRLSADKPELIKKGALSNVPYIDPYPAMTEFSGYRAVHVSKNGDYITADNKLAFAESSVNLECNSLLINIGVDFIELPYNIELTNSWKKDFKRTSYLGGTVTGDWNDIVNRDTTVSTVIVKDDDFEILSAMRKLSEYCGDCFVRTPDGSAFHANVQVSETQRYNDQTIEYSLSISKIDSQNDDMITREDWLSMINDID